MTTTLFDLETLAPNFAYPKPVAIAVPDPRSYLDRAISLALRLEPILSQRELGRDEVLAIGNEIFGGSIPNGAWRVSTAYNAIEAALARLVANGFTDVATLLDRVPTQTRRTLTTLELQQFSTPPTIGAIATKLANLQPGDVVLEPSCGTALLAAHAAAAGASLILNELDTERGTLAAWALNTPPAHAVDARELPLFYSGESPSVVIMNPPFTEDGTIHGSEVATRHISSALSMLRPGGRLVAIVGQWQHPDIKPEIWKSILANASLRTAIAFDGKAYARFGTGTSVAIVVLDKVANAPLAISDTRARILENALTDVPVLPRTVATVTTLKTHRGEKIKGAKTKDPTPWTATFTEAIAPLVYRRNPLRPTIDPNASFVTYIPTLQIDGALPHPDILEQPASLASTPRHIPTIEVLLPTRAVTSGALSDVQLETIIYALDATTEPIKLLDENDSIYEAAGGHMIGHGTGAGKGRINAGIFLARILAGADRHLWISETVDLFTDAMRDWTAVAGDEHANALFNINAIKPNNSIPHKRGIGFTTFSTLRMQETATTRSRATQLDEFAKTVDTIIIDESHNAANANGTGCESDKTQSSLQGRIIRHLQTKYPKARIIYVSATSITKIDAFSYCERLAQWGPETQFASRPTFLSELGTGGLATLELACRELFSNGRYQSVELRTSDIVVTPIIHELSTYQIDQYNAVASFLRNMAVAVDAALEESCARGRARAMARSQFEIMRQRVLETVLISFRVGTALDDAQKELEKGNSPVFQIVNTGEAAQSRAIAKDPSLEQLDLSPRESLMQYLDRAFPTQAHRIETDDNGKETSIPMFDEDDRPILNPVAIELRETLRDGLKHVLCPDSAINIIIRTLTPEHCAEVTGRTDRVLQVIQDGVPKNVIEHRAKNARNADVDAFMDGEKTSLVFSTGAGGVGRSYHADPTRKNHRKRIHYALQIGWRSDKAIQSMGRTNRTNQVCKPEFRPVFTDAPGEKRFTSTASRGFATISATTRGQRDAVGSGMFSVEDNLETQYGQEAVNSLLSDIYYGNFPLLNLSTWFAQTNLSLGEGKEIPVRRFLNRVLACDLGPGQPQQILFDAFYERLQDIVSKARATGTYDEGIQAIRATSAKITRTRPLATDERTGAVTELLDIEVERPLNLRTFATAIGTVNRARSFHGHNEAYFVLVDGCPTAVYRTSCTEEIGGKLTRLYGTQTPQSVEWTPTPPAKKRISDRQAETLWNTFIDSKPQIEKVTIHLLVGPIFKIFRKLGEALDVGRITLDDNRTLLGTIVRNPIALLTNFEQDLNSEEIGNLVRSQKDGILLKDSLLLQSVRYANERVIELLVPMHLGNKVLNLSHELGLVVEQKNFKLRFFVPPQQLQTVLGTFPILKR